MQIARTRLEWGLRSGRSGMNKLKGNKELLPGGTLIGKSSSGACDGTCATNLSLRDLVERMAERGLHLAHTTIMRWVQRYVPEFEKCWARYARQSAAT